MDNVTVKVMVILAGAEAAVLLFNKEEEGYLRGFRQADLSRAEVFTDEVVSGLMFLDGERIEFPYLGNKGLIKIDGMVVGVGGGYVVGGFFGEDLGKFDILSGEGFLGFLSLSLHGKVGRHGELVDCGGCRRGEELRPTSLDAVDDEAVHSLFCGCFREFGVKVPA